MIELEKYKKISSIGKQIGYLFDCSCDNYKIKSSVTYASKNYFVTSDGISLRKKLGEEILDSGLVQKIYQIIQNMPPLNEEERKIYENNIYIPDDDEFIANSNRYNQSELAELYFVPKNIIWSKIAEINIYVKQLNS